MSCWSKSYFGVSWIWLVWDLGLNLVYFFRVWVGLGFGLILGNVWAKIDFWLTCKVLPHYAISYVLPIHLIEKISNHNLANHKQTVSPLCVVWKKKHFHKFQNNIGLFFTLGFFCRIFAKMSARLYKMILKQNMPYLKIRMKPLPNRYYDLQNHFLRTKVIAHKRFDQKNQHKDST